MMLVRTIPRRIFPFLIFLILTMAGSAQDILYVTTTGSGDSFTSIQEAVENASDGDTIRVAQGTYLENIKTTGST